MKKAICLVLALVLVLGLSVTALAAELKVTQSTGAITIDGKVDDWSAPVFTGDRGTCWGNNGAHYWDVTGMGEPYAGQTYDVYLTTDDAYTYVALKINSVLAEPTYPAGNNADALGAINTKGAAVWGTLPQFTFSIGAYDAAKWGANGGYESTTTPVSMGAMVSAWRVGLVDDGGNYEKVNRCLSSWVTGGAISDYVLTDDDYSIVYDDVNDTYIYEVRVPHSATNITGDTEYVALDLDFATPNSDGNGSGYLRYLVGTLSAEIYDGFWNWDGIWGSGVTHNSHVLSYFNAPGAGPKEAKHIVVHTVDTKVGNKASVCSGNIAIDGTVNADEWGEPVVVTTPGHCQATWGNFWEFDPPAVVKDQVAKLYITNDKDNVYLALTLDKCEYDATCTDPGNLWKAAHFAFSIGKYDETNTLSHIEFEGKQHEQFTAYYIGLANDEKAQTCETHGINAADLPDENYAVKYDAATKTYTYEVKLPVSMTNINLHDTRDVALSVSIGTPYTGAAGANRYNITTGFTNANINKCTGECTMNHKNDALRITLNDTRTKILNPFVLDKAPAVTTPVKLDGVITDKEWGGTPVVVTNPSHCQTTWGNFWQFDPSSVNPEQEVKLYVTNDADYLYVGATIDECDYDTTCTDASKLFNSAHLMFSVSGYDEETTVKRIEFEGDTYEQYTAFMMGLVNGKKGSYACTQGHDPWDLADDDYAIKYDESTRTYTYEVRIPFAKTNITTNKIAISASVSAPYTGGEAGNLYNITTASASLGKAYNWAHLNNALVLTLATTPNNNPNTGDMNVFVVVAVSALAATGCVIILKRKNRISVK